MTSLPPLGVVRIEDPRNLLTEWINWFDEWLPGNTPSTFPVAWRGEGEPDDLLAMFLGWWRACPEVPAKLPKALQVRTVCYLVCRSLETERDYVDGMLSPS